MSTFANKIKSAALGHYGWIIVLGVILIVGSLSWVLFAQTASDERCEYFIGNLYPEIFGFLLELIILVCLVGLFRQSEKKKQKKKFHSDCSRILGFLVESIQGNSFHWSKLSVHCQPTVETLEMIQKTFEDIKSKNLWLTPLQKKVIIETAHEAESPIRAMTPCAYDISSEHGVIWLSILASVKHLAELYPYKHEGDIPQQIQVVLGADEFCLYFPELLEQIIEFEKLDYEAAF
ncbi:MAG: hypothetical protein IPJ88_04795 [Myxococcales bacterium]|nr:MAG: hypothetical protein IPJ88_04795 [Myxococcales bacterium]